MTSLFGIPNCGSVKKGRAWLAEHGIDYVFVDFKKSPPPPAQIQAWLGTLGRDTLLNRKGTSWRALSDADKASAHSDAGALALIERNPSLIKRPLVQWENGAVTVGFDPDIFAQHAQG